MENTTLHSYTNQFTYLAKNGKIKELEFFVFSGDKPFFYETKHPQNLSKNILGFLAQEQQWDSLKIFFSTKFNSQDYLTEDQKKIWFKNYIYIFSKEIFLHLWEKEKFQEIFKQDELKEFIYKAIHRNNQNVYQYLLEQYKDDFSEEEQMNCLLNTFDNYQKEKDCLENFKNIEKIFSKIKYHQRKDILWKTIMEKNFYEYAQYLLWNKKIRLTTNMFLDSTKIDFQKMIEERRLFDSRNAKIQNKMKKLENDLFNKEITKKKIKI